jgi:hypothetical protein
MLRVIFLSKAVFKYFILNKAAPYSLLCYYRSWTNIYTRVTTGVEQIVTPELLPELNKYLHQSYYRIWTNIYTKVTNGVEQIFMPELLRKL